MAGLTVDVSVAAPEWREMIPDVVTVVRDAAAAAWRAAANGRPVASELSVLLAGDETVRRLNAQHRGADRPTNVLSFPIGGDACGDGTPAMLGDVVLASGVVAREARAQGKAVAAHLRHLVVHGVLHLLGYDHESGPDAERMERLEVTILAELGVPDPYREIEVEAAPPQ